MAWVDAFAKHEALYKAQVMNHAWGHLLSKPGEVYLGHMVFFCGQYGNADVLEFEFGDLDDSPWLMEDTYDLIWKLLERREDKTGVYRFDGVYPRVQERPEAVLRQGP